MRNGFRLEDFFLRVFKGAILTSMSLALLAALGFVAVSAYSAMKRPTEPVPVKPSQPVDVTLDDLKKELLKNSESSAPAKPERPVAEPIVPPPSLKYLEDVTYLYRCTTEFAKLVSAEIETVDNATIAQQIEALRSQIETLAEVAPQRGDRWVKSVVKFTCSALGDTEIIALRKSNKIQRVFLTTLNFHLHRWDQIAQERAEFDRSEAERFERETHDAQNEQIEARANAFKAVSAAGIAFGVFMALAFYLILAKIETNLRVLQPVTLPRETVRRP